MRDAMRGRDPLAVALVLVLMALVVGVVLSTAEALAGPGRGTAAAPPWQRHLHRAEAAARAGDAYSTRLALTRARLAARRSPDWTALLDVGDAAVKATRVLGTTDAAPAARRAYVDGMVAAKNARSVDGMVRVAEGFAALGDRAAADQALDAAARLARQTADRDGLRRVHAAAAGLQLIQ